MKYITRKQPSGRVHQVQPEITKPKKRRDLTFRQMDSVEYIEQDGFMFQWCCHCHLRHVWHFHIVRGETPDSDYVAISIAGDEVGTKLRKEYEKHR